MEDGLIAHNRCAAYRNFTSCRSFPARNVDSEPKFVHPSDSGRSADHVVKFEIASNIRGATMATHSARRDVRPGCRTLQAYSFHKINYLAVFQTCLDRENVRIGRLNMQCRVGRLELAPAPAHAALWRQASATALAAPVAGRLLLTARRLPRRSPSPIAGSRCGRALKIARHLTIFQRPSSR
jgi:hypothetical protein